jgi:hypothetical protein
MIKPSTTLDLKIEEGGYFKICGGSSFRNHNGTIVIVDIRENECKKKTESNIFPESWYNFCKITKKHKSL